MHCGMNAIEVRFGSLTPDRRCLRDVGFSSHRDQRRLPDQLSGGGAPLAVQVLLFWPLEAHGHDKRPRRRWLQTRMLVIAISPPVQVYGVPVMGFYDLR